MPLQPDIYGIIDPLLLAFSRTLKADIEGELIAIYISGTAQMTEWAGLPFEGPPSKAAINFARTQGAKLVTQMNEETKRRLAHTISEGIKNKRGIPGITADIRKELGWMARGGRDPATGLKFASRAEMIARTETANALGESFTDRGKDLGVTGKEWIWGSSSCSSGVCPENEQEGVIPFDQLFPSGHMTPPAHPNCTCATAPVML